MVKILDKSPKFLRDEDKSEGEFYAYVYDHDPTTIYLGSLFWVAGDGLTVDSKIGTLIHEVSHFQDAIGTDDLNGEEYLDFKLSAQGNPILESEIDSEADKESSFIDAYLDVVKLYHQISEKQAREPALYDFIKIVKNACNLEYEIEIRFGHKGDYKDGQWTCCGNVLNESVCRAEENFEDVSSSGRMTAVVRRWIEGTNEMSQDEITRKMEEYSKKRAPNIMSV